ncbi:hypothetical protein F5X96DRAFT_637493 [Biscogniauxia mediterranea]|nr:hypothetical protein F5X96DRAFT_637493 [Biscogniauxia mediterranea]
MITKTNRPTNHKKKLVAIFYLPLFRDNTHARTHARYFSHDPTRPRSKRSGMVMVRSVSRRLFEQCFFLLLFYFILFNFEDPIQSSPASCFNTITTYYYYMNEVSLSSKTTLWNNDRPEIQNPIFFVPVYGLAWLGFGMGILWFFGGFFIGRSGKAKKEKRERQKERVKQCGFFFGRTPPSRKKNSKKVIVKGTLEFDE